MRSGLATFPTEPFEEQHGMALGLYTGRSLRNLARFTTSSWSFTDAVKAIGTRWLARRE